MENINSPATKPEILKLRNCLHRPSSHPTRHYILKFYSYIKYACIKFRNVSYLLIYYKFVQVWKAFDSVRASTWTYSYLKLPTGLVILLQARSQNCEKRLLVSSRLSVCPSVRMKQLVSHCTDLHEIWYLGLRKYVEKCFTWIWQE